MTTTKLEELGADLLEALKHALSIADPRKTNKELSMDRKVAAAAEKALTHRTE